MTYLSVRGKQGQVSTTSWLDDSWCQLWTIWYTTWWA